MHHLLSPKQLFEQYKGELLGYTLRGREGYKDAIAWVEKMRSRGYPKRDIHSTLTRLFAYVQNHEVSENDDTAYEVAFALVEGFFEWRNTILPKEPPVVPLRGSRLIHAPITLVWNALTNPSIMKKWIYETEVEIISTFEEKSPFIIRGNLHGMLFENKGIVWAFNPPNTFIYSYISSLSGPDTDELDKTEVHFDLEGKGDYTLLKLNIDSIRTEVDFKHLQLYWNVTLDVFKKLVEEAI